MPPRRSSRVAAATAISASKTKSSSSSSSHVVVPETPSPSKSRTASHSLETPFSLQTSRATSGTATPATSVEDVPLPTSTESPSKATSSSITGRSQRQAHQTGQELYVEISSSSLSRSRSSLGRRAKNPSAAHSPSHVSPSVSISDRESYVADRDDPIVLSSDDELDSIATPPPPPSSLKRQVSQSQASRQNKRPRRTTTTTRRQRSPSEADLTLLPANDVSDQDEGSIFGQSDLSDDEEEEEEEYGGAAQAAARSAARRGRAAVARSLSASEGEDASGDSETDSDVPMAASGPSSGLARGSMQEEQQYETAKQREKRLKRQAREARSKKPSWKQLSQYQKNKLTLERHHPELTNVWEDLQKSVSVIRPTQAEQPKGLNIKLLPFQLEGLDWLTRQEKGPWKGGMLADEMGMGKTIQMISLMLSDRKKPNLVVAPTVAIMQWRNEIEQYTEPKLSVMLWHGANRSQNVSEIKKADVVLTSYAVLESCFRKQESGFKRKNELIKEKSALHHISWNRIILDEAHNIKERSTNTAKGSFALKGEYRWCLSGTPLQNRVGELYSMIRFLGGDPYAFYFCKRCSCKSLHWSFSDKRHCDSCGHTPMHHTCFWNNEILKPIQVNGAEFGEGKDAFGRLRLLLERMMLRRTKLERSDDMGLPPRTVEVRRDLFNEEEEDLYASLYTDTTRKFSTYLDQGTVLNNYSNIFTLLTRMRQLANHPDLVLRSKTGTASKLLGDDAQQTEIHVCRICADEAEDAIMSRCRHIFCRECVSQYLETDLGVEGVTPECPYCHATLSIDLEAEALEPPHQGTNDVGGGRQGMLSRLDMSKWRSSTKIEALVEELSQLRSEDKTIKSLVFSQFVNFLDLIAFRLQRAGFSICRLEGNMSPEARNRTIQHFMQNPSVTVFLVSLKAGGVALNLTEASRVYLMDPWWNPSVEVQAMDRIHRLGQHRPIVVKRMIIENSIESRIIELQNKKSAMIEAAIGKDESAMGRLSVADLRFLFTL